MGLIHSCILAFFCWILDKKIYGKVSQSCMQVPFFKDHWGVIKIFVHSYVMSKKSPIFYKKVCNYWACRRSANQHQAKHGAKCRPILSLRAYSAWQIVPAKFQCCITFFLDKFMRALNHIQEIFLSHISITLKKSIF